MTDPQSGGPPMYRDEHGRIYMVSEHGKFYWTGSGWLHESKVQPALSRTRPERLRPYSPVPNRVPPHPDDLPPPNFHALDPRLQDTILDMHARVTAVARPPRANYAAGLLGGFLAGLIAWSVILPIVPPTLRWLAFLVGFLVWAAAGAGIMTLPQWVTRRRTERNEPRL